MRLGVPAGITNPTSDHPTTHHTDLLSPSWFAAVVSESKLSIDSFEKTQKKSPPHPHQTLVWHWQSVETARHF
jgi:hypothetical protein